MWMRKQASEWMCYYTNMIVPFAIADIVIVVIICHSSPISKVETKSDDDQ